jgi:hypothetical protein
LKPLPKITGWHADLSGLCPRADYLVNGERTVVSLTKDQDSYTLWYKGQVYQRGILQVDIKAAVQRILGSEGNAIAPQPKATKIGGISID